MTRTILLTADNKHQVRTLCSNPEIRNYVQQRVIGTLYRRYFWERFLQNNCRIRFDKCGDHRYLVCETFWSLKQSAKRIKQDNKETEAIMALIFSECTPEVTQSPEGIELQDLQKQESKIKKYVDEQSEKKQSLCRSDMYRMVASYFSSTKISSETMDDRSYFRKVSVLALNSGRIEHRRYDILIQGNQVLCKAGSSISSDEKTDQMQRAAVFYKAAKDSTDLAGDNEWSTTLAVLLSEDSPDCTLHYGETIQLMFSQKLLSEEDLEKLDTAIQCYTHSIKVRHRVYKKLFLQLAEAQVCKACCDKKLSVKEKMCLYNEAIKNYDKYRGRVVSLEHDGHQEINNAISEAYYYRGNAKYQQGDYNGAMIDYDRAIKLNFQDSCVYNNRGSAKYNQGKYDEAISDYKEAIRLNSENSDAYYNCGNAKYQQGRYAEAISYYNDALGINPQDALANYNRKLARKQLIDTNSQAELINCGNAKYRQGRYN